uniref:Uncharacterized protein n=1 Tax=uncultured Thiotrichaceae bacterium TaxID=298394 RepID=A0A6S6UKQ1_9GAMM|nr:MAG: Unknown protein [uncultured Thiotrichaceae bacterium]
MAEQESNTAVNVAKTDAVNAVTTPEEMFDAQQDAMDTNEEGQTVNGDGEVTLISNPDDESKVDTITGDEMEMTEEEILAAMSAGDDIRDSQTVKSGTYIVSMSEIRPGKDVKFVYGAGKDGKRKIVREKSIGFRIGIHFDYDNKELLSESMYKMCHMAKADGSVHQSGRTEYKQLCANAVAAVLGETQEGVTMEKVMKMMTEQNLVPLKAFNQYAGSTDDDKKYFLAKIKELPAKDGYPASNDIVIGSLRTDNGYYATLTAAAE